MHFVVTVKQILLKMNNHALLIERENYVYAFLFPENRQFYHRNFPLFFGCKKAVSHYLIEKLNAGTIKDFERWIYTK